MRGTFVKYIGISALLALSLAGCGQSSGSSAAGSPAVYNQSEFGSYVTEFEALSQQSGNPIQVTDLMIQFGSLDSSSAERGECVVGEGTPTITIDEDYWNSSDENTRKTLIFHELGHCVLHREHLTGISSGGYPLSLMNAYTVSGYVYEAETDYYNAELFTHENQF